MTEYRYTTEDRREQLAQLSRAIAGLLPVLKRLPEFQPALEVYAAAQRQAEVLRAGGFTPEQLAALGHAVPDLLYRHKEWEPPAVRQPDGTSVTAPWFTELDEELQAVLAAARLLYTLGYY